MLGRIAGVFCKSGAGFFRPFRLGIFVDHDDLGARIGRRSFRVDGADERHYQEFFPVINGFGSRWAGQTHPELMWSANNYDAAAVGRRE
ncbi:MAG: hypothetical protein CMJ62_02710 [Planctomycetaceae bacterium]|nr:hypothetical protein [Planctomycetaceae bacterium]